jgi:alginate O-acetyltransferase complex protein AlgI
VLLLFSLLFYAWGEPVYVFLMLAAIVLNYLAGLRLRRFPADTAPGRRRLVLILAVLADLAILGFFKYSGFFTEMLNTAAGLHLPVPQIVLPIGISFYIFQSMSYVIDVYRGDADAQRNILSFGTYVALFPQLIAGPIVRYRDIALQLTGREETVSLFASGAVKFIYGLAKKVLLANQMGLLADRMLLREGGTLSAWVGMAAYTLQIFGQRTAPPVMATIIMSLESVFAVLSGAIFLHEIMSGREITGCVIMFIALLLVQISDAPKK